MSKHLLQFTTCRVPFFPSAICGTWAVGIWPWTPVTSEPEAIPLYTALVGPMLRRCQETHEGIKRKAMIKNVQRFWEPQWVSNELFAQQTNNSSNKTHPAGAKTFIFSTLVRLFFSAGAPEPRQIARNLCKHPNIIGMWHSLPGAVFYGQRPVYSKTILYTYSSPQLWSCPLLILEFNFSLYLNLYFLYQCWLCLFFWLSQSLPLYHQSSKTQLVRLTAWWAIPPSWPALSSSL